MNKHEQAMHSMQMVGGSISESKPLTLKTSEELDLFEPLSVRETQVLQALSAGMSNREVANHLFIAVETVKNHLKSIYSKLQVNNRTKAVYRASLLNLIE